MLCVLAAALGVLLGSPAGAWADADLTFESPVLADCTKATNQFPGVTFVNASPDGAPSIGIPALRLAAPANAHSGTHLLQIGDCSSEFDRPQIAFQLAQTRAGVSLFARDPDSGFNVAVQLRAFNASGVRIDTNGSTYTTLVGGAAAWTQLSAVAPGGANDIATVAMVAQNQSSSQGVHVLVDDIHLSDGAVPPVADFTLGPAPVVVVSQGAATLVEVPVNRLNGSTGAINFAAGAPPAGFEIAPTSTTSSIFRIFTTLSTPPGPTSLPVTGTPSGPAVGPAPRSTDVPVVVQPTLPRITIVDPAVGTQLERVPYEPTVSGDYVNPRYSITGRASVCVVVSHTFDPPSPPSSPCPTQLTSTALSGSWTAPLTGLAPGYNYITAFIRDGAGYVGSATRTLRIADESSGIDLRVTGMELTQGIQAIASGIQVPPIRGPASVPYRGVQLVAGRTTTVRVYANTNRAARSDGRTPGVTARLRVMRGGHEIDGSPFLPDPTTRDLVVGEPYVTYAERADFSQGYTFTLPASVTNGSALTFEAQINDGLRPIVECATCAANDKLQVTDTRFRPVRGRDIWPIELFDDLSGHHEPTGDAATDFELAREVNPFPLIVHPYQARVDITSDLQAAAAYNATRTGADQKRPEGWLLHVPGDWERDHGYDGPVIGVGRAQFAGMTSGPTAFCCSPLRIKQYAVVDETRPLTSVAHEYGHTEGLPHADHACGGGSNGQVADGDWPEPRGLVLGIGYDAVRRRTFPNVDPASGALSYDFMSYCANNNGDPDSWISTRNWDRLVDRMSTGAAPASIASAAAASGAPHGVAGPALAVDISLGPDGSSGVVTGVRPVDSGALSSQAGGAYQLVVPGRDGKATSTTTVAGSQVHDDDGAASKVEVHVTATVPAGSDPRSIQLRRDGVAVASAKASAHAPTVSLLAPRPGTRVGKALTVRWHGADADGDRVTYAIDEAIGPKARFRVVSEGLRGSSARIPLNLLTPARRARLRIRAWDGFRQSSAVVARIAIPSSPPAVSILEPARRTVPADATLSLVGQAFDATGRTLKGRALTWRLDGAKVATGPQSLLSGLRVGTRRLTLTARDRSGLTATATVRLKVKKVTPRLLTFAGPKKLARSARTVTVKLSASAPGTARISGGVAAVSAQVARRARSVRVKIAPGSKSLKLTVRLSAGGRVVTQHVVLARG